MNQASEKPNVLFVCVKNGGKSLRNIDLLLPALRHGNDHRPAGPPRREIHRT